MDSMRSLNKSLPSNSPSKSQHPPERLIQAFKTAALSVTNLYKDAAAAQVSARTAGYQDALENLLAFLDKENIGLDDGEGWRIRSWATERLDGQRHGSSDSDEDAEEEKPGRSTSPELRRGPSRESIQQEQPLHGSEAAALVAPEAANQALASTAQPAQDPLTREAFTFRSSHPQLLNPDTDMSTVEQSNASSPPIRLEVLPRHARSTRHDRQNNRAGRSSSSLGAGAGVKRRVPFGDFFDIGGFGNGKDGLGGGGKRGRHV